MMAEDIDRYIEDYFLSVRLNLNTLHLYPVRTALLKSVKEVSESFYGTVLDVGCGVMPYRSVINANPKVSKYIGMDLERPTYYGFIEPDLKWNGQSVPLDDESVDCVMATEFLEHYPEPEKILKEIHRVMKTGGLFFATVPFIWSLHEIPYDEYRYTPYSLERHLKNAGFTSVDVKALGGWNMALAQMLGLWSALSGITGRKQRWLQKLLLPVCSWLVKNDKKPTTFDDFQNSMFNGLSVTARK